jgi:hypothetical protein
MNRRFQVNFFSAIFSEGGLLSCTWGTGGFLTGGAERLLLGILVESCVLRGDLLWAFTAKEPVINNTKPTAQGKKKYSKKGR